METKELRRKWEALGKPKMLAEALLNACASNKAAVVEWLLEVGADAQVAHEGRSPLTAALQRGYEADGRQDTLAVVQALLGKGGAQLSGLTENGKNAVHLVAHGDYGFEELAQMIVLHAVSLKNTHLLNASDEDGVTPIHELLATCGAGYRRSEEVTARVLELFLASGASKDAPSKMGYPPLHAACARNLPLLAVILLKAGADPNAFTVDDTSKETALYVAARSNFPRVVHALISHGVKDNVASSMAVTIASQLQYEGVLTCLKGNPPPPWSIRVVPLISSREGPFSVNVPLDVATLTDLRRVVGTVLKQNPAHLFFYIKKAYGGVYAKHLAGFDVSWSLSRQQRVERLTKRRRDSADAGIDAGWAQRMLLHFLGNAARRWRRMG